MKFKKQFKSALEEQNVKQLIIKIPRYFYREVVRNLLPTVNFVLYNGVKVQPIKMGDKYLPADWLNYSESEKPHYETALINGLRNHVKKGDHIVIIGGGNGVTTVIASILTGAEGKVTCYEASIDSINKIRKTINYNNCPDNITIHDKCVGKPVYVWGEMSDNKYLDPALLPDCDILELDCEGSEKEILQNFQIKPRTIFVETHGIFNSATTDISLLLKDLNYNPVNIEVADIDLKEYCENNDIKVITAHSI